MEDEIRHIIRPQPGQRDAEATEALLAQLSPMTAIGASSRGPGADGAPAVVAESLSPSARRAEVALVFNESETFASTLAEIGSDLLVIALQVSRIDTEIDVPQLHRQALQAVQRFRHRAVSAGIAEETVQRASYLLCSLVDEAVLNTPWGEQSLWSQRSLLRLFHQETWGGERVFRYIDAALNDARHQQELLEVAFFTLTLGFEGKYRVDPKGPLRLEQLREEVYRALGPVRERAGQSFAPAIEPMLGLRRRLHTFSSLWLLGALLAVVAFSLYHTWLVDLNHQGDRLRSQLAGLLPVTAAPSPVADKDGADLLRKLLAPEVARNVLRVESKEGRVAVVLQAEAMFDAGSADVAPAYFPILHKVGKALEAVPGRVVVAGHTDNRDINTARFPSNWHLSLARASEVVKYMATTAALRGRMLPEGRGDSEPIADNDSAAGRARNRRVVIEIHPEPSPSDRLGKSAVATSDHRVGGSSMAEVD